MTKSMDLDQALSHRGSMRLGPDDRASLLSSITNGPHVEVQHGEKASGRYQEICIGMIGNGGVGKTSLLRRFVKEEAQNESTRVETIGYDDSLSLKVRIGGEDFKIKFGDTAGQERYGSMTKSYF